MLRVIHWLQDGRGALLDLGGVGGEDAAPRGGVARLGVGVLRLDNRWASRRGEGVGGGMREMVVRGRWYKVY
jgi:hypothetical protein